MSFVSYSWLVSCKNMHKPEVNHFEVDPFDTMESYFKNKQLIVFDYLIYNLNTRINE